MLRLVGCRRVGQRPSFGWGWPRRSAGFAGCAKPAIEQLAVRESRADPNSILTAISSIDILRAQPAVLRRTNNGK